MLDLDRLIREADPARKLVIPAADEAEAKRLAGGVGGSRRRIIEVLGIAISLAVTLGVVAILLTAGQSPITDWRLGGPGGNSCESAGAGREARGGRRPRQIACRRRSAPS
jgi:hypothetical protein